MLASTASKELQDHETKLKNLGFRNGIIEFLLENPSVDTGLFTIRHVAVEDEDMESRRRGDGGINYRTDIYAVERDGRHIGYYRIKCEFDSWDTYEWDMMYVEEVKRVTKKITVWENA